MKPKLIPRTQLYKKLQSFQVGDKVPTYKKTVNKNWKDSDINWKYYFLDTNRESLDDVLDNVAHKRGLLNVLLNEGYAENMINTRYKVDPDSAVVARNPSTNPGSNYEKRGNFGLDNLEGKLNGEYVYERLGYDKSDLTRRRAHDNTNSLLGKDKMTLREASKAIDMILNDGKKLLYNKYGAAAVSKFFKENPGAEDRMLYAYYRIPSGFNQRLKKSATIQDMYNTYTSKPLNESFKKVDRVAEIINTYFNSK